jgi:hypothetical protein
MKLLKLIKDTLKAVYKYVTRSKETPINYPTFEENLFVKHYGETPAYYAEVKTPFSTDVRGLLKDLDPDQIYSRVKIDEYGFWEEEIYQELFNVDCLALIKVVLKKSVPYEFIGDRLNSDNELRDWELATKDLHSAFAISSRFGLMHVESITIVSDDSSQDFWRVIEQAEELKLQRSTMLYVNMVGQELKEASKDITVEV